MKKMKKYVIGFVASMVLSTGLVTVAFASGLLVWGGEDNIEYISDTLNFLGGRISEEEQNVKNAEQANVQHQNTINDLQNQVTSKENEIKDKEKEIKDKQKEVDNKQKEVDEKQKEVDKKQKDVEKKQAELDKAKQDLNDKTQELATLTNSYNQLETERDNLSAQVDKLTQQVADLQASEANKDGLLEQALIDVQVLRNEAELIRSEHE